jgi:hypothetical protein
VLRVTARAAFQLPCRDGSASARTVIDSPQLQRACGSSLATALLQVACLQWLSTIYKSGSTAPYQGCSLKILPVRSTAEPAKKLVAGVESTTSVRAVKA